MAFVSLAMIIHSSDIDVKNKPISNQAKIYFMQLAYNEALVTI